MSPEPEDPRDPHVWVTRARSSLAHAGDNRPQIAREDLCFDAQQAAEKALKGLLLARVGSFPYIHDLARLVQLLEDSGIDIPQAVKEADELTTYATETRYPMLEPVSEGEYEQALRSAGEVVRWVEEELAT